MLKPNGFQHKGEEGKKAPMHEAVMNTPSALSVGSASETLTVLEVGRRKLRNEEK